MLVRLLHFVENVPELGIEFEEVRPLCGLIIENTIRDTMPNIHLYKNIGLMLSKLYLKLRPRELELKEEQQGILESELRLMLQSHLTRNKQLVHELTNQVESDEFELDQLLAKEKEINELLIEYPDAFYVNPDMPEAQRTAEMDQKKYDIKLHILASKKLLTPTEIERKLKKWLVHVDIPEVMLGARGHE
jgi:hypothetical protein